MTETESKGSKDFKSILRDQYRSAYGSNAAGGRPDETVASFAAGLITAGVLSSEEAGQALEEGIAAAQSDWTPEAIEAFIKRHF